MIQSQYVVQKAGQPFGRFVNRPSVEYTGRGDDLCCFAWNGRYFRSSIDDVKKQCAAFAAMVNGTNDEEGEPGSIADLEIMWGLIFDDSVKRFGWSPSENWAYPCFTFDELGPGTECYDRFGEKVWLISIPEDASPYECYWED